MDEMRACPNCLRRAMGNDRHVRVAVPGIPESPGCHGCIKFTRSTPRVERAKLSSAWGAAEMPDGWWPLVLSAEVGLFPGADDQRALTADGGTSADENPADAWIPTAGCRLDPDAGR